MIGRLMNLAGLLTRRKPAVGATPADVVHAENKWKLLRFRPRAAGLAHATPILLVPSLINRWYVLDLMPGKSFVEFLVSRGHDVYVIDHGTPGDEDRYLGFDDIVDGYLGRALRVAAKTSTGDPRAKVHVLGYCMGGTMAAIHAAAHPERFASLVAVAAPIRFDSGGDDGLLAAWSRSPTVELDAVVAGVGNMPWELMQSTFLLLRPTMQLSKAVHLMDRAGKAWDDEFLDGFLALETWGNDNVSFPGAAWRRYIRELYREDRLFRGTFALNGRPAQLSSIVAPTLAVTFEHDAIVPKAMASVLVEQVGATDKEHVHLPGGHVGAMVSRSASRGLWPKIAEFWEQRPGGVRRERETEVVRRAVPSAAARESGSRARKKR